MKKIVDIHCSGLSRPMTCAGSLFFENLPPQPTNSAAMAGTACGELLQMRLEGRVTSDIHIGIASNGVEFDEDMQFYSLEVAKDILKRAKGQVLCETKIDWQTRSGIIIAGKYDASYVDHTGKLCIDDLKYGWNIVDVKEDWQLIGYAIGEIIRRQQVFQHIKLTIHQPRPHHEDGPTRSWEITYEQLLGYKEQIEARMLEIVTGHRDLVTSNKCKYCPAALNAACPALGRAVFHGVDYILSDWKQDSLNNQAIAEQMDMFGRIQDLFKIQFDSLEALALSRIQNGEIVPGYTTKESFGDRQWKKTVTPEVIKVLTGVDITKKEMMSPAQSEKAGVPKELVKDFVDRYFKGVKVVKGNANKKAAEVFGEGGVNVRNA